MSDTDLSNLSITHQSDNGLARVSLDPATNKISAGVIENFGDHAAASLQVIDGNVEGTLLHTGDTHSLRIDAKQDGSFEAEFSDTRSGLDVRISGGVAEVVKGRIPSAGLSVDGDHHRLTLALDADGKLSGTIESQDTRLGSFRLEIDGGEVSGFFRYSSDGHETEIGLTPEGWKASVSVGRGDARLAFSVEHGHANTTAFAGLKLKF